MPIPARQHEADEPTSGGAGASEGARPDKPPKQIRVPPGAIRPVAWYSPTVLWRAALELSQSGSFQRNLDRRELLSAPFDVIDLEGARDADESFAFDFLADTGDGGDAAFAVASGVFADELVLRDGSKTSESPLLVLGGDLAYPGASPQEYQRRLLEPFKAARRMYPRDAAKDVLAIPQNHDWFDSVSTFCRYFVNDARSSFLHAATPQKHTYFAARLPHRWWILGLDFAATGDLDRMQFDRFVGLIDAHAETADKIRAGDSVILVVPRPYWTDLADDQTDDGYPRRHQRLEGLIEAAGASIRLRLSGDLHHYVRELAHPDTQATPMDPRMNATFGPETRLLVTCGTGGAFTHATHTDEVVATKVLREDVYDETLQELRKTIVVGRTRDRPRTEHARLAWPDRRASRGLSLQAIFSIFRAKARRAPPQPSFCQRLIDLWESNLSLIPVLGAVYAFAAYSYWTFEPAFVEEPVVHPLAFKATAKTLLFGMYEHPMDGLASLAIVISCMVLGREGAGRSGWKFLGGALHGFAHLYGVFLAWWLATSAMRAALPGNAASPYLAMTLAVPLGGAIGALVLGSYLTIACRGFGQMTNNAFGAIAHEGYKGFMRFRITKDELRGTMLGVEEIPRTDGATKPAPRSWEIVDEFTLTK